MKSLYSSRQLLQHSSFSSSCVYQHKHTLPLQHFRRPWLWFTDRVEADAIAVLSHSRTGATLQATGEKDIQHK